MHTIAVAGKGGVGKTTICGMTIDYLYDQHFTVLLAGTCVSIIIVAFIIIIVLLK